ncbi:MAG: response regulator [Deltaproteobacteria bacterium]|nr:response regulator [Deltaproteobacteria bacterium]MBW2017522.1 response regulator [Deltaproteobacteria bacterium]MBW2130294.1 response regulator [Deltaproteobacteria bacterium]MBW2302624.1 response regulator [Deltaproteobacteria bacterium]
MKPDLKKNAVLIVDDEENILGALRRLLRKEPYKVFTASSGEEGLNRIREERVQVVVSDQRMPGMSGTEFLARVREEFPDIIRIVLTGYTNLDSIMEAVNKGHVYKLFLKPWNDEALKLEIRRALDQYHLVQTNKKLSRQVLEQNEALKALNENLGNLVHERTRELEVQNRALELSREILEHIPLPVLGVSSDGLIVLKNRAAESLPFPPGAAGVGKHFSECFSPLMTRKAKAAVSSGISQTLTACRILDKLYDVEMIPLKGKFEGKGVILAFLPASGSGGSGGKEEMTFLEGARAHL